MATNVEDAVVHRAVERHAAAHGDRPALVDAGRALTYRDLNHRANAVARRLMAEGFRRGAHLRVSMAHGADLATALLAVLKAGGAYTWSGESADGAPRAAIAGTLQGQPHDYRTIDLDAVLRVPVKPGPNLPVLIRPGDIACVVEQDHARDVLLIPHAAFAAPGMVPIGCAWTGDRSTFDLWAGLVAGRTLSVEPATWLSAA